MPGADHLGINLLIAALAPWGPELCKIVRALLQSPSTITRCGPVLRSVHRCVANAMPLLKQQAQAAQ
jgi:hypothetical protein